MYLLLHRSCHGPLRSVNARGICFIGQPLRSLFLTYPKVPWQKRRTCYGQKRLLCSNGDDNNSFTSLIKPLEVELHRTTDTDVGAEITGISKTKWSQLHLNSFLNRFFYKQEIRDLAADKGLDEKLFTEAFMRFRRFIMESDTLPPELHIIINDQLQGQGVPDDLFPFYYDFAKKIFPHLMCIDELRNLSDLTRPPNWYPDARSRPRKVIYHAGPTNSGKTYHALKRFMEAESGIYCGPLRLLASEVFHKSNKCGTMCDLVTGEERQVVRADGQPARHVSCTVEMASVNTRYEVAVIDEIQMLRDTQRGWAWTRAFLGLSADEVHVCGEATAVDLVHELAIDTCDDVEVKQYKRLTRLTVQSKGVDSFDSIKDGDAVVCFNKNDIYNVSRALENEQKKAAIIYGSLPAETKLKQAETFNDQNSDLKVLVATDAIGMGLNLSIQRIVFYTVKKLGVNKDGAKKMSPIPPHMALQIAGRAGRYGTAFEHGTVTTFKTSDLTLLKQLLNEPILPVQKAGLFPTADQIEQFQFLLPKASLANLIDIFAQLSAVDSDKYFLCDLEIFKTLASMIEHIPMPIKHRYMFCCSPVKHQEPFICSMFLQFAARFGQGLPLTLDWLCQIIDWPFKPVSQLGELTHLENVFDVTDLYLWLSYRFPDMLPEPEAVLIMQKKLNRLIQDGVSRMSKLKIEKRKSQTKVTSDQVNDRKVRRNKTRNTAALDPEMVIQRVSRTRAMKNVDEKVAGQFSEVKHMESVDSAVAESDFAETDALEISKSELDEREKSEEASALMHNSMSKLTFSESEGRDQKAEDFDRIQEDEVSVGCMYDEGNLGDGERDSKQTATSVPTAVSDLTEPEYESDMSSDPETYDVDASAIFETHAHYTLLHRRASKAVEILVREDIISGKDLDVIREEIVEELMEAVRQEGSGGKVAESGQNRSSFLERLVRDGTLTEDMRQAVRLTQVHSIFTTSIVPCWHAMGDLLKE